MDSLVRPQGSGVFFMRFSFLHKYKVFGFLVFLYKL